jgi:three-Cys-motif partner protein
MSDDTQWFGGDHTSRKLEAVETYLRMFTTALRQKFDLIYIDACAGSGSSMPKSAKVGAAVDDRQIPLLAPTEEVADTDEIIVGSALRALGLPHPFNRYFFNDIKRKNVRALQAEVDGQFSHLKSRVSITQFDANEMLDEICRATKWKGTRGVVFLDPFGLQIKYETLERLAQTRALDIWYLVPVFAMYRQVRGDGEVLSDGGKSVDEALGTKAWRDVVATEKAVQVDMFDLKPVKAVDVSWFEKVAQDRLREAFDGRVLDQVLPLGKPGLHEFSLMFAWANPDNSARLAAKFASAVLK